MKVFQQGQCHAICRASGKVRGCDPALSTKNRTISHYSLFPALCHTFRVYLLKNPISYKISFENRHKCDELCVYKMIQCIKQQIFTFAASQTPKEQAKNKSGVVSEMCVSLSTNSFLQRVILLANNFAVMAKEVDRPTRLLQFVAFVHSPFSFQSLDLFVASLLFGKGTSFCVIRRKQSYYIVLWREVIGLFDFRSYLHVASLSLTPL